MLWTDCRIVAFDTETTGLRAYDGDRIIEFGAVELFVTPGFEVSQVRHHQMMINPGMPIPREATNVSKITDDDVADAPPFGAVAEDIWQLLSDSIVVAHNLGFDIGFLREEFGRCGRAWPRTRAEVDTLPLATRLMTSLRSRRLERVAEALGIPLDNAHRAVHDAEACGRIFVSIANRYGAPADLDEMIDWAVAVGPPPETGHVSFAGQGVPQFMEGPHEGESIERHPDYLQWMTMSREHTDGQWSYRYPESLRLWASRWLRARTAGRAASNPRGAGAGDWNLDPRPISD
jgi:DNA polymerase III subunit epsilon